jgi:SAM-dependent MidA family methyltransferase
LGSADGSIEFRIPHPESRLVDLVRDRGPLTVAAFMELALYHPELGYYARAGQRSGRAGDFFTSVDVGPLFGELLEVQIAEMADLLQATGERAQTAENNRSSAFSPVPGFDLVEAGAGNGRLAADILRAARARHANVYDSVRLHLVETSEAARAAQRAALGEAADRLASSSDALPPSFDGVLIANELLDAMPVHQVVMRENGLREIYVSSHSSTSLGPRSTSGAPSRTSQGAGAESAAARLATCDSRLATWNLRLGTVEGAPSSPALQAYLDRAGVTLEPGWGAEINLRAVEWVRDAARRLSRGFMILIDYGHEARELYSATHSAGTLTSFAGHRSAGPESPPDAPGWLQQPGERDITAHVDFTSVRAAAEAEGMTTIAFLDQTYFLMGLLGDLPDPQSAIRNPQCKTLIVPGGLGSTQKVLILAKGVGTPALKGCSFKVRVT